MEKSKKPSHSSSLLQLWYSFFQGPFLALNFCDVWSASKIPNKNPFIFLSLQKITTHCFIIDPTTTSRVSFSHKISQRTHMSGEKAKIKIIPQKPIKKALQPGLLSTEAEKAASLAIRPLINWQQTCLIIFPSAFFLLQMPFASQVLSASMQHLKCRSSRLPSFSLLWKTSQSLSKL